MILLTFLSCLLSRSLLHLSHHTIMHTHTHKSLCFTFPRTWSWATCSSWPCLNRGFGLDGLKKIPSNIDDSVILYQIALILKTLQFPSGIPFNKYTMNQGFSSLCWYLHWVTLISSLSTYLLLPGRTATVGSELQYNSRSGTIDFAGAVPWYRSSQ